MKNFLHTLTQLYYPVQALIVYQRPCDDSFYIESNHITKNGRFAGAHPLTEQEAHGLAERLIASKGTHRYLQPSAILEPYILHVRQGAGGFAIWHTPAQKVSLLFDKSRSIPDGEAYVPALLWKACNRTLQVFALSTNERPTLKTQLFHAPFYNMSTSGNVCMGTVALEPEQAESLEKFTQLWQHYFFASYFTHTGGNTRPVNGSLDELWRHLIATGEPFPVDRLRLSNFTIKQLL